ncbi:MAG: MOSC domain-containing protein [Pseudomonadota bacterium]
METRDRVAIAAESGLDGDHAGKYPDRIVTVMAAEAWAAALAALDPSLGPDALDWTTRRANLLVEGAALPRAKGGVVKIGAVVLEVTGQTWPCKRMEEAQPGLLKALAKDWRGGLTCKVIEPGETSLGDPVEILVSPPEIVRKLP